MPKSHPRNTGAPNEESNDTPVTKPIELQPGSREYYESLLYSLTEGILVFDMELRLAGFNRAAEEMALLPLAESLGRPASDVLGKANEPLVELALRTLETGRPHTGFSAEIFRQDASRAPVEASAAPMDDAEGRPVGVLLVLREASRIRELEEEVKKSERLAYLGTMAASVAHEVRNPLGGIKGASQLLRDEVRGLPNEESLAEYINVVIRQVDRLTGILDSLKGLSKPVAPKLLPVNLHSLLDEALTLMAPDMKKHKVKVRRDYDPSMPEVVANESGLSGVFINLIKNAVEAMPRGGVLTLVTGIPSDFLYSTIKTDKGKKTMVAVKVSDTGSGIEDEAMKDIFNPFYSTKGGGLGLGLALSLKVVEEHGGTIKVDSEPGKGTVFTVYLPVYR
ncbi:MAG: PAS domain-containing protein [Nitrospirae bacterium]|nr:PAS domain-containing protein [Nitrospirota bacterium]